MSVWTPLQNHLEQKKNAPWRDREFSTATIQYIANCYRHTPVRYLEVGVNWGKSFLTYWKHGWFQKVTLIDPWNGKYGDRTEGQGETFIRQLIKQMDLEDITNLIPFSSENAYPMLKGRLYDVILIDGDHSRIGFNFDLQNCWELAAPNALIVCDDLLLRGKHDLEEEFDKFVEMHDDAIMEFKFLGKNQGIGILRKRP